MVARLRLALHRHRLFAAEFSRFATFHELTEHLRQRLGERPFPKRRKYTPARNFKAVAI